MQRAVSGLCLAGLALGMWGCAEEAPGVQPMAGWMSPTGVAGFGAGTAEVAGVGAVAGTAAPAAGSVGVPLAGTIGMGGEAGTAPLPTAGSAGAGADPCATGMQDSDGDGSRDCDDGCPQDAMKTDPGTCGCGQAEPVEPGGACGQACQPDDEECGEPVADAGMPMEETCVVQPTTEEIRAVHGDVYTRYVSANGVPVLASDSPQDEALRRACLLLLDLGARADIHETMLEETIGLVVMGVDETSADFPEFARWGVPDSRARGLGGVPRGLCAEKNIMCDRSVDRWRGESICVHEFAHTMHLGVYNVMDRSFNGRVQEAYRAAISAGKYNNTYAASNATEYFAEGVQNWYNTNLESARPNGVHNEINTRSELLEYDPGLYEILAEVLPDEPTYRDCYYYE